MMSILCGATLLNHLTADVAKMNVRMKRRCSSETHVCLNEFTGFHLTLGKQGHFCY